MLVLSARPPAAPDLMVSRSSVSAELAGVREEPGDELLVRIVDPDRLTVDDPRRFLPMEWYAAEPCDQWLPAVAFDPRFKAGA